MNILAEVPQPRISKRQKRKLRSLKQTVREGRTEYEVGFDDGTTETMAHVQVIALLREWGAGRGLGQ